MKKYLKLLRIKHYFKNSIVFLPLLFSGELFDIKKLLCCLYGVFCFCMASSIVYIINDIKDVEKDRRHPIKKNRPIASGKISISSAVRILIGLFILILLLSVIGFYYLGFNYKFILLILIYVAINILYSFGLKNIPIIDVMFLSFGFVIRLLFGGCITNIEISNWLFLTVLSGTLYMGLGKRRNELLKNKDNSRKVLSSYNKDFLDKNMYMFLGMTLIFYCLWVVKQQLFISYTPLIYSIILVFFIMMRYSLIVESDSYGDPVDVVVSDKILIISIISYMIYVGVVLYV